MTPEQILALATSAGIKQNAQKLAKVSQWLSLNANDRAVWGELKGSGKEPYQVRFDRNDTAYKCSCPSRQQPCKHSLALMLLYTDEAPAFGSEPPPPWVTSWIVAREARAQKKAEKTAGEVVDTAAQAKRIANREEKVSAGIEALDLWLRDLVRGGFDGLPSRSQTFWETPAARMVDAQAKGLANQLRDLVAVPGKDAGWASTLLERIGLLYLLVDGYRHQDQLPPALREDVRAIVGWSQKQDDLLNLPAVRDHWLVLSQRSREENGLDTQRTWLRGLITGQTALHLEFSFGSAPFELRLPARSCINAEVIYYPSHYPQRVLIKDYRKIPTPVETISGDTIPTAYAAYTDALRHQPWLNLFPMLLKDVYPLRTESGWIIRDADGQALPIGHFIEGGWKLLAISGGYPLTIFGEWDGTRLLVLNVWTDERIILM